MNANTLEQAFVDRLLIRELIDRSSDRINHQEWTKLMELFTSDITWERLPPTPWQLAGHDAVLGFLSKNAASLDILLYAIVATSIEVRDAEHASARSTMSELIRFETGAALHVVGTYSDEFVKTNGSWLFSRRTIKARYEEEVVGPRIFSLERAPRELPE